MLTEIKYIQNVGRFATARPASSAPLNRCTLVFGENGWGKSTLADVLRSLGRNDPAIVKGRITLPAGVDQKVVLRFGTSSCVLENGKWQGGRPHIAVYDSVFVNENIYSGDTVSADHMKNQYGLAVGEGGVTRVHRLVELDDENRANNDEIRNLEAQLTAHMKSVGSVGMQLDGFLSLAPASGLDDAISVKEADVSKARRAKEIKAAPVPGRLPVPTDTDKLLVLLDTGIRGISTKAVQAVREHIANHQTSAVAGTMTHEAWLEIGTRFPETGDCPFCGQVLTEKALVEVYADFFGQAYKSLSAEVTKMRATLARYQSGDFRRAAMAQAEHNVQTISYWKLAAGLSDPRLSDPSLLAGAMEDAAHALDEVFQDKQANLTTMCAGGMDDILAAWDKGRKDIIQYNQQIDAYATTVKGLKGSIDEGRLVDLEAGLKLLNAIKRRHEPEIENIAARLQGGKAHRSTIATGKEDIRKELNAHVKAITDSLGKLINEYLGHLDAGFRIDYQEPNYQSKEPAASYLILINDHPVSPRASAIDEPSFRNTLSAGDKSTLALAFFMARMRTDPNLADAIIVLDDPFTSLDSARRQFTANEIKKLCGTAQQVIVLSHDKNFLRLLWDKIDHDITTSIALQTGAPGITTIAPFDIEGATKPRHVTERIQIQEFLDGEDHDSNYIRTRLRTVCEDFYRKGDPGLFRNAASLEEIIRQLDKAPDEHPYKMALEGLREINEYSRSECHAAMDGNPSEDTTIGELRGFCRRVIALTRGL